MKILMLLESEFPPDIRVENEIAALTDEGHEIHLACITRKGRPVYEKKERLNIHRKPESSFIYKSSVGCLKFPFYFNFWRKFVNRLFEDEKFDAIHIHDLPLGIIGSEIKQKKGVPFILDLHENWPALLRHAPHTRTLAGRLLSSDRQWIEYEKRIVREADLIITIIEEARDRISSLGIDSGKICVVSNTISTDGLSIPSKKGDNNEFVLFYGGGINKHRGLQIVLNALKLLAKHNMAVKLQVVGAGSYLADLKLLAKNLGVESMVSFMGHKPYLEMLEILAGADAAIIPHLRTENNDASSPNKLYQYMFLGKSIISSDCLSLKRIISETDSGFIYRNDSPEDLAELLVKLYNARDILREKGANGKNAVIAGLNWNSDKSRLVDAYRKLEDRSR
jgi:glycosyltransferase involved in cell wall biosynthesis